MKINVSKSGLMMFNIKTTPLSTFYLYNEELPVVKTYEYLGIMMNNEMDINQMANHRVTKAKKLV